MKNYKTLTNIETGLFETKHGTILLVIKEKVNKENDDTNIRIYEYIKSSIDDEQTTGPCCIEEFGDKYEYFDCMFCNYDVSIEEALNEILNNPQPKDKIV